MSGEVMNLLIEEIDVSSSHRAVNAETVQRLAASLKEIGLQHPVTVRSNKTTARFDLIAGRHRLEAARAARWDRLPCRIVKMDDDEARMWEISENLHRAELTTLERSEQIAEYAEIARRRRDDAKVSQVATPRGGHQPAEKGVRAAAEELGLDKDAVSRAARIAAIAPEAKAAAIEAGFADNQSKLLKVAAAPVEQQPEIVRRLAAAPKPVKLAPEPTNDFESREQWMAYMMRGWNRAPAAWREHFFERVDGTIFDETAMGAA